MSSVVAPAVVVEEIYDRSKEVKDFDDSKLGVKGLLDSGITSIPRIFYHPPESLPSTTPANKLTSDYEIPTVDLSRIDTDHRFTIVDQIKEASSTWGFFQVINHDVPLDVLNRALLSIKAFNEQPNEVKSKCYCRENERGMTFASNFDLFQTKAASWRDTLQMGMDRLDPDKVPEIVRNELIELDQYLERFAQTLMEMLGEGLGLERDRLENMACFERRHLAGHYYPYCPEADRTVGTKCHTDPSVFTILLQDQIGGLQVKHGENWVDVQPCPGALVINIGDILQIMSNDIYPSVEHRVVTNTYPEPRISIALFFNPSNLEILYGPLPEVITPPQKPALYKQFTMEDFMMKFKSKGLDGKSSMVDYFLL
ncbi:hypothetical protein MKW94_004401 [Papaver nudicaule]|uniref:Fe2OG dioxygenase domain-containing protein n=1 Tax=Papaver nudicaule TaxID=74823 RepID=A0AA41VIJ0_PAPNU|nr:hypothetical protein [Papaver nudicaule]